MTMSLPPVARFGRYTIIEALATGGMSYVYLARRDASHEYCVIKVLRSSLRDSDVATRRFRREAHVASFLDHPNIARIVGAGVEEGSFFIAYEFIPGQMLSSLVERLTDLGGALPLHVVTTVVQRALEGLIHAHELADADGNPMEIVHRDLSPNNIMLSYRGEVKLIDFGVARGNMNTFRTHPGTVVGTPQYMSPEQVSGQAVDARTDLYTLGVVFYELLTGQKIIPDHLERVAMFQAVMLRSPGAPSAWRAEIPRALDDVVMTTIAKHPSDRFQSARELHRELRAATEGLGQATPEELAELIRRLFPMERRHLIALSQRATGHDAKETIDDLLESVTRTDGSSLSLVPPDGASGGA